MHMATPSLGTGQGITECSGETKGLSRAPLQLVAKAAFCSNVTPPHPHLRCGCAGTWEGVNAILGCLLGCGFNAFFVLCSVCLRSPFLFFFSSLVEFSFPPPLCTYFLILFVFWFDFFSCLFISLP